jgi:hypothetical protein
MRRLSEDLLAGDNAVGQQARAIFAAINGARLRCSSLSLGQAEGSAQAPPCLWTSPQGRTLYGG